MNNKKVFAITEHYWTGAANDGWCQDLIGICTELDFAKEACGFKKDQDVWEWDDDEKCWFSESGGYEGYFQIKEFLLNGLIVTPEK